MYEIQKNYGEIMDFEQDNTIHKLKLLFVLDKMEIPLTENNIIDIPCVLHNDTTHELVYLS